MKRVSLAIVACAAAVFLAGCGGGGGSAYELIPGVPFPATYLVQITPDGYDAPLPAEHRLSIVAPTAQGGHDFDLALRPVGSLETVGAVEVSTARSPGTVPVIRGRSVLVSIESTDFASAAQFRGVVGYEATGAALAQSGNVRANFYTDADGFQMVEGSFELTTANPAVAPLFRTYKGTFEGQIATSDDGGDGGGDTGPPDPPY